jgi:hypothetical protein
LDGGELPQVHGEKPHVLVTVSHEALTRRLGAEPARLNWTGPISVTDARMLACDCSVIPAVLDSWTVAFQSARERRVILPSRLMPALAIRMSRRPKRSTVEETSFCTDSSEVTRRSEPTPSVHTWRAEAPQVVRSKYLDADGDLDV